MNLRTQILRCRALSIFLVWLAAVAAQDEWNDAPNKHSSDQEAGLRVWYHPCQNDAAFVSDGAPQHTPSYLTLFKLEVTALIWSVWPILPHWLIQFFPSDPVHTKEFKSAFEVNAGSLDWRIAWRFFLNHKLYHCFSMQMALLLIRSWSCSTRPSRWFDILGSDAICVGGQDK